MFRFCTQCLGKAETADIKTTCKSMFLLYLTNSALRHVKEWESKGTPPCTLVSVTSRPLDLRGEKTRYPPDTRRRKYEQFSVTSPLFAGIYGPECETHTYVCKTYRHKLNDMLCISHTKSATENKEVIIIIIIIYLS